MVEPETLYPLEIVVDGTPVSLQGSRSSKERWKYNVRAAARDRIQAIDDTGFLDHRPLAIVIYYFPAAPMQGDIDNIVKPIMDALIGVAYLDDRDVERIVVQKFEPEVARNFLDPSEPLTLALGTAPPCVYIRIDDDLIWRDKP